MSCTFPKHGGELISTEIKESAEKLSVSPRGNENWKALESFSMVFFVFGGETSVIIHQQC